MRVLAFIYALFFLAFGLNGLVVITPMNLFRVNMPLSLLYIACGLGAVLAGVLHRVAQRLYFQIIGILFGILALLGFLYEEEEILAIFASNLWNTWLHMILATSGLILGYGAKN